MWQVVCTASAGPCVLHLISSMPETRSDMNGESTYFGVGYTLPRLQIVERERVQHVADVNPSGAIGNSEVVRVKRVRCVPLVAKRSVRRQVRRARSLRGRAVFEGGPDGGEQFAGYVLLLHIGCSAILAGLLDEGSAMMHR